MRASLPEHRSKNMGSRAINKRCPVCKKLRKFCPPGSDPLRRGWTRERGRWLCPRCSQSLAAQRDALFPSAARRFTELRKP